MNGNECSFLALGTHAYVIPSIGIKIALSERDGQLGNRMLAIARFDTDLKRTAQRGIDRALVFVKRYQLHAAAVIGTDGIHPCAVALTLITELNLDLSADPVSTAAGLRNHGIGCIIRRNTAILSVTRQGKRGFLRYHADVSVFIVIGQMIVPDVQRSCPIRSAGAAMADVLTTDMTSAIDAAARPNFLQFMVFSLPYFFFPSGSTGTV